MKGIVTIMKIHTLAVMLAALAVLPMSVSVFADTQEDSELLEAYPVTVYIDGSESEVGDGEYKGYDLYYEYPDRSYCHNIRSWWWSGGKKSGYTIEWLGDGQDYSNAVIKVPDKINRTDVISINKSCGFKTFDLDPENKYMKCVDNVIFSKDGKRLISYAVYDQRTEYEIPYGTEVISENALSGSKNLTSVIIPDTVNEIECGALSLDNLTSIKLPNGLVTIPDSCFWSAEKLTSVSISRDSKLNSIERNAFLYCYELTELVLPSFDIKIDRRAFGESGEKSFNFMSRDKFKRFKLKSYAGTLMRSEGNTVAWDKVSNASYYEIYQKKDNGEYILLGKTSKTSHTFGSLKQGAKYTFAVKPIAVIPAANYDKEKDEGYYPETFTIEGTMSEDVVVRG